MKTMLSAVGPPVRSAPNATSALDLGWLNVRAPVVDTRVMTAALVGVIALIVFMPVSTFMLVRLGDREVLQEHYAEGPNTAAPSGGSD